MSTPQARTHHLTGVLELFVCSFSHDGPKIFDTCKQVKTLVTVEEHRTAFSLSRSNLGFEYRCEQGFDVKQQNGVVFLKGLQHSFEVLFKKPQ